MARPTRQVVNMVRQEMTEKGFSLVRAPHVSDASRFLPTNKSVSLSLRSKVWWKYPQLAIYGSWLESLLKLALPEESVRFTALEFRKEAAGYEDETVDKLHADGSYIRSVWTVYGLSTSYRDGHTEYSVPPGQTLLMTAMDRARALGRPCTLHRRPGVGRERAVIVCTFEPRARELRPPWATARLA
jgi:hypothetical protein